MPSAAQTLELAVQRQNSGDSAGAERLCREILRVDPAHGDALYLLGIAAARQNRPDEAVECFERLAVRFPRAADLRRQLAALYRAAGRLPDAAAAYGDALQADPADAAAYNDLGIVFQELNESAAALACFRQAVLLRPEFPEAISNLAVSLEALGEVNEAIATLQSGTEKCPRDAGLPCTLGILFDHLGRRGEARDCFEAALHIDPQNAAAHFELGDLLQREGRLDDARRHLQLATGFEPQRADAWRRLGEVLFELHRTEEALPACERAVELAPSDAAALANLGHVLRDLGRNDDAVEKYRRALALDPESAHTRYLLAKTLYRAGRFGEAVSEFRQVQRTDPHLPHLDYHLGNALKALGRYEEAVEAYEAALAADAEFLQARYELGNAHRRLNRFDEAERCYNAVLEKSPDDPAALVSLGNVLKTMDRQEEAAAAYRKVLRILPDKDRWELWIATLCPAVFEDNAAIDDYRYHLHRRFAALAESGLTINPAELIRSACPVPYNLQFQGRDDRPLKECYAKIFRQLPAGDAPINDGKPRVGIVVTAGHDGVFLRYLGGVLRKMKGREFDVEIVCAPSGVECFRSRLPSDAIALREIPNRIDEAVEVIRGAAYDVLYYWEVGSDAMNYFLPFFRLAAVQCTGGGLPETSATPCMDYFLSTGFVEPDDAERHYSERLIRAETLLTCQPRMPLSASPKTREEFGFPPREHVYLCPHKIEKFHPDFDALLAGILRADGRGRVVIPSDRFGYAAGNLHARLSRRLPDVVDRVTFLPHLSFDDYLSLTAAADVVLDPLHYGGGLTAYDGFSLNKAIVTLPGRFVRGRYPFGLYRLMGVEDCIAADTDDYVGIAVRLGTDAEARRDVERRIADASDVLFDNRSAAAEHERIFERLIAEARGRSA